MVTPFEELADVSPNFKKTVEFSIK